MTLPTRTPRVILLMWGFLTIMLHFHAVAAENLQEMTNCPQHLPLLKVLPGRGWCNLRNKEMGQVQFFTYHLCKTTPDGLFLIPDNAFIIPVRESSVQLYAEIIDSWKNYSSATSKSINVNADASFGSIASISGSYSQEYQTCKKSQVNDKSVTTRVQARYDVYTVGTSVDDNLDGRLLSQLQRAIDALKTNNEEEVDYLLELVVREYGTHLLTRVDAGAAINQEEYVTRAYRAQFDGSTEVIKASASARFFDRFGFSGSYTKSANQSMLTTYEHNLRASNTQSFGGMLLKPHNMSIDEWVESIPKNLVAIDREGDPLHFIITPTTFPQETLDVVDKLRLKLQGAIGKYFSYNKHIGCMNIGSKNFDYNANIDNNMCKDPANNYTFGGVFQTCQSVPSYWSEYICLEKNLEHRNILTQDFSCPHPYEAIPLMTVNGADCQRCWWWFTCCVEYSYTTKWCAAVDTIVPNNTGLMFGGLFTSKMDNPLTQVKACPPTFIEAKMFEDLTVCIGKDFELGVQFSAKFGGFFSCQKGNPLYNQAELLKQLKVNSSSKIDLHKLLQSLPDLDNQTTKACPTGYTQHTSLIQNECLISYCVKAGSFALHGEMPVVLPPFKNYTGFFSLEASGGNYGSNTGLIIAVVCLSVALISVFVGLAGRILWKRRVARLAGYDLINNAEAETEGANNVGDNQNENEDEGDDDDGAD